MWAIISIVVFDYDAEREVLAIAKFLVQMHRFMLLVQ